MSVEEKLANQIRSILIKKYGIDFLKLSEKNQNNLIVSEMREYVERLKNNK